MNACGLLLCDTKLKTNFINMKPQVYGVVGIVLGLLAFLTGLGQKSEPGFVLLIGGIFFFGCGLVAAAIGASK
jgi:hypothetical protein